MTTSTASTRTVILVKLVVCHGDYREEFFGTGPTILRAAEAAARQSNYSSELFNKASSLYASRYDFRKALEASLKAGEPYRGFGWCDFTLLDDATEADKPDPVDAAIEAGTYPKFISDEKLEELIQAHAVAARRESIRLFPQDYSEATPLDSFLAEARRNLTEDLKSFEYAHAALSMEKDRA